MTNIIPSMRFDEFKYSWKVTTLGEITCQYRESNKNVHHQNLLSLSYGKIVRKDIESKKGLLPASFDTYQIIKKDIIVFRVTDLQNDKKSLRVGISEEEGIITPAYVCMECDTRVVDPHYLYTLLHYYDDITKVYYKMGDGMRQTLAYSDLKELKVYLPNFPEQHKIVECFELLDKQIQISSKKIASLRQMKAASLQAMFPQKGETRPRVRFKGFEGEYSSMTASELFKTFDERNHPELPVLSACQDIRGMAPRSESGYDIFHDKSNEVTYKRVLPGQFVIHLRSFQGGFAHSSVEGICSPAYTVFGFKEDDKYDDYYWKYIFMSKAFIDRLKLITYGIRDGRSIGFKEFMEMDFVFPSYEEQKQISIFFRTIDKQISLEEQKLESLKRIKSACLDKMFV
ncbi:restriction endonuclease subunit S [Bacteroides caecimuris]|uniref:restriction endonuclease subunit S n=1 Tax=Bacteroides caecimuris TaxID=1796613 RepID=UPI00243308DD|nr:restriction endonuclease subunit S [Bacteroides caecimuris]